jgi:hypothetical protein
MGRSFLTPRAVMKKTVILGTTNHYDYVSCYRYVARAWNNIGWDTLTFYVNDQPDRLISQFNNNKIIEVPKSKYGHIILSQVYRLLGHHYLDDSDIIMTSDIDMMPLSDYWNPSIDFVNCYGYDLTGYKHYPICYIAMNKENWTQIIPEKNVEDLLNKYSCASSNDFDDYWYTDQHIITERIKSSDLPVKEINRGSDKYNLATGRIDRAALDYTANIPEQKIDCHLPRPFNKQICNYLLKEYHNI